MPDFVSIDLLRRASEALWLLLGAIWLIGALKTKPTRFRQPQASHLPQSLLSAFGAYLMFGGPTGITLLETPFFPITPTVALCGAGAVLCGVAFSIWARLTLGTNWSGIATLKQGHTLVRSGPYRIVRHPIYTGMIVALAGSALEYGLFRSGLALFACSFGFWLKTQAEEDLMVRCFGEEYLRYRSHVPALIPFIL